MGGKAAAGRKGRRLIVHLGVHKTASTAIQRHLQRNAAGLADRLVVRTPQEGTPMRPLGRAALAYSRSPCEDGAIALRVALEDVLETLPANGLPAILSHENVAGSMPGKDGETRLYPVLPDIARLVLKAAKGFEVEFVYYTRDMDIWRASVWAQAVRSEGYPRDYAAFLSETGDLPGWDDLYGRMTAALGAGRVTRFRLEDEADHARPGRQLLRHAGLSGAEIDRLLPLDGPANERLSPSSTEFLRRLNGLAIHPHARRKVSDMVARAQHLFTTDTPSEGTS
ncbi:hypothetical protein [Paracoccus salsus]|uniref:hypothetical protein n=1 Tax=Paracoccus salsus TaxID=2911061 RepID=UPI001F3AF11D|nr:hypothetical protein [Paracoccus salsus]MCF3974105.1 hypothetical protein [Paracoccus salsus]